MPQEGRLAALSVRGVQKGAHQRSRRLTGLFFGGTGQRVNKLLSNRAGCSSGGVGLLMGCSLVGVENGSAAIDGQVRGKSAPH